MARIDRLTHTQVAEKYPQFTPEEVQGIRRVMGQTWDAIAFDCMDFMDDPEDTDTIVELTVDAGRLGSFSYAQPDKDLAAKFYEVLKADPKLYPELPRAIYTSRRG